MGLNQDLKQCLKKAYDRCIKFQDDCVDMCWNPSIGHIPRGFCGASGDLKEVELVLVFAEPGKPKRGDLPTDFESAYECTMNAFRTPKYKFHKNVRMILNMCWPPSSFNFDEQMRKVWLTESVLCSAKEVCGSVSPDTSNACGERYLRKQLLLFPNALIVALGKKAQNRMDDLQISYFSVHHPAPPEGNKPRAISSWEKIPIELEKRRQGLQHQS